MFRTVSILTVIVCAVLFALLLLSPESYVGTYGVTDDAGAVFMVRRAAPMFLGFAVMLWFARDAGQSRVRDALCWGIAVAFTGVALTGMFEYMRGVANAVILAAATGELLIAALFLRATKA
ncbi:MAG: hypothetical protein ACJAXK_001334 [Yoonia sp.]|jgi:uncharacterized protein YfiM (DUF2279 family)